MKIKKYCFLYALKKKSHLTKELKEVGEREPFTTLGEIVNAKVLRQACAMGRTRRPVWLGQREEGTLKE